MFLRVYTGVTTWWSDLKVRAEEEKGEAVGTAGDGKTEARRGATGDSFKIPDETGGRIGVG